MYTPTWQEHEKALHTGTAEEQVVALDKFLHERDKELKNNPQAQKFEKDRKEQVAKEKPQWIKEKRKQVQDEQNSTLKSLQNLKKGGSYQYMIQPSNGYILVQPDKEEEKEIAGIILVQENEKGINTGKVIRVGAALTLAREVLQPPVQENDYVMYKWFAGMEVDVQGTPMRLMQFTDILGKFEI